MRPLVLLLASTLAWPASAQERSGTSDPPVEPAPVVRPAPVVVVPTPPPREPVTERRRPNVALLGSGVTLLVLGYVADVGFTYGYDHHPASTSLIPVVGPWIQLHEHYGLSGPPVNTGSADADARANQTVDSANRTIRGLAYTGAIATGLVQAAGLALVIAGAITRGKPRRTSDVAGPTYVSRPAPLQANGMYLLEF